MKPQLRAVLAALWLGGLAAVGLIGAPTLFALLPEKMLAAALASAMFERMALAGLALGGVLLVLERPRADSIARSRPLLLLLGGLLTDVLGQFAIVPQLLAAAAASSPLLGWWHGLASLVYALQAGCVLAYVWGLARCPR